MTSEGETQKTSEFLRRRKLRLQQVREQSKDIAKKIRQRAKVEKLRQVVELDQKKERAYIQSQENVVKKLEELYSRGLDNVGSSHRQARGLSQPVSETLVTDQKTDVSHVRGKEAAAELRKQKQQKFNEIKKALDRKVQAREAANVLSREKSTTATNKLFSKYSSTKLKVDEESKSTSENINENCDLDDKDLPKEVPRNDMGTQWDLDLLPAEWEPNIPALAIPKDDSIKESGGDSDKNTGKQKRPNLFALSDEMPWSLRGGTHKTCDTTGPSKFSSTLVSEYIQNRALRLRESEVSTSMKKHSEDLKNVRQTIIRSRPLQSEGSNFSNICHVIEGQVVPMPMWRAETRCQCHSPRISRHTQSLERKQYTNVTHSDINKIFSSIHPMKPNSEPFRVPKKTRPLIPQTFFGHDRQSVIPNNEPLLRGNGSDNLLVKKKSITMYNHSTRDSRDVPRADEHLVRRAGLGERDAYAQALSESMSATHYEKRKKNLDTTNKIAVTRQNVEKEYKDTIAFLNSLPRNKNTRPINNAFKDDHRLQAHREVRQRILQQEFKNIEQESRRQVSQGCKTKSRSSDKSNSKRSKSPSELNDENHLQDRDFQYSWMPVPESDSNLAVHTIPLGGRAQARAGGVRFGAADAYHEYRSRHKHTPPTKDTSPFDKHAHKRIVETVILQNDDDSSSGAFISDSSTSSADGQQSVPKTNQNNNENQPRQDLTDAERIIIYKVLSQRHRKKSNPSKINRADDIVQNNEGSNNTKQEDIPEATVKEAAGSRVTDNDDGPTAENNSNPLSTNNLNEGVYKVPGNTEDNLESMYYSELNKKQSKTKDSKCDKHKQDSLCRRNEMSGDFQQSRMKCNSSNCKSRSPERRPEVKSSSCSSNKTTSKGTSSEAGFVKLIDDGERQEGNFYIGATGFLKDDAYEVIIQLRKKDAVKEMANKEGKPNIPSADAGNENTKQVVAKSLGSNDHVQQEPISVSEHIPVETTPQCTDMSAANSNQNNKSSEQQRPSSARSDDVPSTKTKHDRSVSPLYNDKYPLSEPLPRSDPIVRPATSTYTQTTLSSPGTRPAYIHMSSSTSTAYMSPPEVVLPNFLRRGHEPCRKAHRSSRNIGRVEGQEHHCNKYSSCKISKKMVTEPTIDQLPSSAVSTTAADEGHGTYNIQKRKRDITRSSPDPHHMRNNRCPKCNTRGDCKPCPHCRQYSHKTQQQNTANFSKSVWNTKHCVVRNKKSKANIHSNKSYLNPRIKEYIQKLLSLNREGIKAIQIINQECSSVNTPGSSVINIPSNRNNKTSYRRHLDLSLERMKHALDQRIYLNDIFSMCRLDDVTTRENVIPRNLKLRKRNPKKKKLHKVKSLNISKKITIKSCDASNNGKVCNSTKREIANNQDIQGSPSSDNLKSHEESRNKNIFFKTHTNKVLPKFKNQHVGDDSSSGQPKTAVSSENSSLNSNEASTHSKCIGQPIDTSTQTNRTVDEEMNFIKLAEGKLQNMEKIADLTEKCSKRLSNLAKVLEEVRKSKSLAYSHISTSDSASSDSDQRPDKIVAAESELNFPPKVSCVQNSKDEYKVGSTDYESLLAGITKPGKIESSEIIQSENVSSDNSNPECTIKPATPVSTNEDYRVNNTKCRNRPPPALLRINLKRPQENLIPHELSTVLEVDSPSSVKFKSQSSTIDPKKDERPTEQRLLNPELVVSIVNKSNNDKVMIKSTDSSDESKLQMMDLNQFNEIMLRPFISLQEYAQEFFVGNMDTKCESIPKEIGFTDDISSLHSDGSLPDVVAELLKRKLITEPFKFDTASNVNSTTVSSDSTLSALVLPKPHKLKSKSKISANKENVSEISDSLSISSNPDLENAFKKLGMGWASSTLKKTKERLALSSSSNTSSSSLSQIKFKNSTKLDVLGTDSISSVPNLSKKPVLKQLLDVSKNAEQQTSFTNSMTVKEFLTKELAKKITFTDKSDKNDTNLEFVSLFETKLPEGLKDSSQTMQEDNFADSAASGNNNRARTSTPVNILKSVAYHSSSSSNMSNGLFSNADDLSSVKLTSTSMRYQSTSEKDELTIPNCSLKMRKALSDCSKTDSC